MFTTEYLLSPDAKALTAGNNSFTSNWANKRSCPYFHITVVLYGTGNTQGTLSLQGSNAPEAAGNSWGMPMPNPLVGSGDPADVFTIGGTQAVNQTSTTVYQFTLNAPLGCAWVRVKYAATNSVAGINASVYFNGCFSS